MTTVLVLAGGPDAEHEVSLQSATGIAKALRDSGRFGVEYHVIERSDAAGFEHQLGSLGGEVIFPVLHGLWGEGGPLQEMLERDGRMFVGSGSAASRLAMDKVTTKLLAANLGIPTPPCAILGPVADASPLPLPVVLKPTHEGSSVGLHLCYTDEEWETARDTAMADARASGRAYLVEQMVGGPGLSRELTVPMIGALGGSGGVEALPVIEITPAEGTYDYAAKYTRGDTRYCVEPDLADEVTARLQRDAASIAEAIGVRHLARVDFMLPTEGDWAGIPQLLEINTMPGFTATSLLPKGAAHTGMEFPELCDHLVSLAMNHEYV